MKWQLVMMAVLSTSLIACSGGMQAPGSTSSFSAGYNNGAAGVQPGDDVLVENDINIEEIELEALTAEQEAEQAFAEAQAELGKLLNSDGSLKIDIFNSQSSQVNAQLIEKPLERVLDKVLEVVERADTVIDQVRTRIEDVKSRLDPNNPAEAAAIARLDELLARYDALMVRLDDFLQDIMGKVTTVIDRLDQYLGSLNPILQFFIMMEVNKVKAVIENFQTELTRMITT